MSKALHVRVVILAGGFGTRVSHLLPGVPKPMATCAGRPFVEWVVRFFAHWGFEDFVLSTGHLSEVLEEHFSRQPVPGVVVRCCAETAPLGTAGGFLNCVAGDRPDFWLVTNGDSLVVADPRQLLHLAAQPGCEGSLLGLALPDASRFGTLDLDAEDRLVSFREKQPGPGVINGGVYAFRDHDLAKWPTKRPLSFEFDVFPTLAKRGALKACVAAAPFIDIGTPETLGDAEAFVRSNSHFFSLPTHDLPRL